jgi:hypothetical protein
MPKNEIMEAGQWLQLESPLYLCCCDCGLMHRYEFKTVKGKIWWTAWRENRSTSQYRRYRKYKCKP